MTWTPQPTSETAWASQSQGSTAWESTSLSTAWNPGNPTTTLSSILYDAMLAYDSDFINYDGYYLTTNIDWTSMNQIETAWRNV